MTGHDLINSDGIQENIHTIRGLQVMLDQDLSRLYGVETRTINQTVKRNQDRFPGEFCFQLSEDEFFNWRSQIVMSNEDKMGLRRPPYAFTEQGVAMLSAVLRSETAVKISVQIINAFIAMRRFIASNAQVFQRIATLEVKQIETDKKIDKVLNAIESKDVHPKQGIFFNGQIFDAYRFVSDLFRTAKEAIVIIDNYSISTIRFSRTSRNVGKTSRLPSLPKRSQNTSCLTSKSLMSNTRL